MVVVFFFVCLFVLLFNLVVIFFSSPGAKHMFWNIPRPVLTRTDLIWWKVPECLCASDHNTGCCGQAMGGHMLLMINKSQNVSCFHHSHRGQ